MVSRYLHSTVSLIFGLRKEVHDFTPFCVHQDVVGAIPGIHWDMAKTVEKYEASWEVRQGGADEWEE